MTHSLTIRLGDRDDLTWAQRIVTQHHYLRQPVDSRARPMVYVIDYGGVPMGLIMLGIPHATRCTGWWGYPSLPTQWQVVDLCRIWLAPAIQHDNYWCKPDVVPGYYDRRGAFRPTTPTWAISEVLQRVQADRVRLWPPIPARVAVLEAGARGLTIWEHSDFAIRPVQTAYESLIRMIANQEE